MKALVLDAAARTARLEQISLPTPGPNELLVRVESISLNPIDPLYVSHPLGSSGRTIGSDFAGTVVQVGSEVPVSTQTHIGDRVAGFLQGACSVNDRPGAFAELLVVPWDLVWRIPTSVTLAEAAGVSLVALTAAQGVWYRMGFKAPFSYNQQAVMGEHPEWKPDEVTIESEPKDINFFVYGASTSVALYGAQMARLSAKASNRTIKLFGAASKARWAFLKAEPYGYDHLVDYRDPDWPEQIRQLSGGVGMDYAYDCISEGSSVTRVCSTLATGGKAAIVRSRAGGAWTADNLSVEPIYGAVWEALGEEIQYQGFRVEKSQAARDFAVAFYKWLGNAIGTYLKPNPVRLMPGGLEKVVEDGFALLGAAGMEARQIKRTEEWMQPVSAEKLVYRM